MNGSLPLWAIALLLGTGILTLLSLAVQPTSSGQSGETAQPLILQLISCTNGAGVVLVLSAISLAGFAVYWLIAEFPGRMSEGSNVYRHRTRPRVSSEAAMIRYIENLRDDRVPEAVICKRLQKAGWSVEEIDRASKGSRLDKISQLEPHPDYCIGDTGDFVEIDWMSEWDADHALDPDMDVAILPPGQTTVDSDNPAKNGQGV